MSYLVSARRWRPQTFEDLVGQEHVSRTLASAIRSNRVAHAFLFTGVRGVGKTTAARILAKALNCEKGPTPTPCNECKNCEEITLGSAVDVLEIDGASNTGVDDVREIIENVRYSPAHSRYKVYIIDEVHMLSNSAFNALLKTLEEPPAHVKFIFATTDPHKLPPTVQSRCQRYDFRRIALGLVVARLRRIVEAEGVRLSDRSLFTLAREGEGSMRDAQSLLDQVLAAASGDVSDEDVLATLGIADRTLVYDVGDAIIARDPARALELVERVHEQGYDMRRFTRDLLEHLRNLAVAKLSAGKLLPDLPAEEATALQEQAARIAADDCDRAFRILLEADEEVAKASYPKLVLDMALIKLATLEPLLPVEDLMTRIEELEQRLRRGGAAGSAPKSASARTEQPRPAAAPRQTAPREAAPPPSRPAVESPAAAAPTPSGDEAARWAEFLAFVTRERPTLAHHLSTCALLRIEDTMLEIEAPSGFRYDYLARRDHVAEVEELAARFFQRALRVAVRARGAARESAAPAAAPAKPRSEIAAEALVDPAVKAAVEILGGEVSEVRARPPRRREDA